MQKFISKISLLVTLLASPAAWAHEGHDEAPGQLRSQHGGIVKPGKNVNLEMLAEGNKVTLYPLLHPGDKGSPEAIQLTATSQLPKGKAVELKLASKGGVHTTEIDFAQANRATLEVKATHLGKTDSFKFQVEKP